MIATVIEMEGTLQADGRLVLDEVPALPQGRVRVSLQPLTAQRAARDRLPDPPWTDDSISAPCDLPYENALVSVQTRSIPERLPDVLFGLSEDSE